MRRTGSARDRDGDGAGTAGGAGTAAAAVTAGATLEPRAAGAIPFTKMHGLGNDYVFVDGFEVAVDDPPALARRVAHRRRGVGSDGLILLLPPEQGGDVRMRMFNADGSEAEMCGNGIRCLARMAVERGRAGDDAVRVETPAGLRLARCRREPDGRIATVTVDMGPPAFGPAAVGADPAGLEPGAADESPVRLRPAVVLGPAPRDGGDAPAEPAWWLVSMGNPHAVAFVRDAASIDLASVGRAVETHAAFPARINVHLAVVRDRGHVVVRTWERGSGATDACGTGACAVAVAAAAAGLAGRTVRTTLPGGDLEIAWRPDGRVDMTGPAVESFRGTYAPS